MKSRIILCLFILLPFISFSQNFTLIDTIPLAAESKFTTDNLGNIFIVSPTNDIEKYDKNGIKLATANFKVLGNITSIDASNPFEIYVFYRDQNKVLFLDNLLNLRGEGNLENIGLSQIACISRSSDNQLWLLDMGDLKLKKYSKELKLLAESAALNTLPFTENINPEKILDINNAILVLNNGNIYEFDIFANYTKLKLADSVANFQWYNEQILYKKNNAYFWFNPLNFITQNLSLPNAILAKNIRIEKERLYIITNHSLILYAYTNK